MGEFGEKKRWGTSPWVIDFRPRFEFPKAAGLIPEVVDVAIVGGGIYGTGYGGLFAKD
jgi:hypothetical protein